MQICGNGSDAIAIDLFHSQLRQANIPDQPDQTFSGNVLAGLQFVQDKVLQGLRLRRSCLLTLTDFLHEF